MHVIILQNSEELAVLQGLHMGLWNSKNTSITKIQSLVMLLIEDIAGISNIDASSIPRLEVFILVHTTWHL